MKTTRLLILSKTDPRNAGGDASKRWPVWAFVLTPELPVYELLAADDKDIYIQHDFGKDIIPQNHPRGMAYAHRFPRSPACSPLLSRTVLARCGHLRWKHGRADTDLASVTPGAG